MRVVLRPELVEGSISGPFDKLRAHLKAVLAR